MKWSELFLRAGVVPERLEGDAEFSLLSDDSRCVSSGSAFVCMPSLRSDSHAYIPDAAKAGAVAFLANSEAGFETARQYGAAALILHEGDAFSNALGTLCRVAFDDPTQSMQVIGITGTNGKTTTAWLTFQLLEHLGESTAYMGTLGIASKNLNKSGNNTTPFPIELHGCLMEMASVDVHCIAMEVSSHALAEKRVDGVRFDVGVFTNLTQDHLDFHGSMERYGEAKRRLFFDLRDQSEKDFVSVVNIADVYGASLAAEISTPTITFGTSDSALSHTVSNVSVTQIEMSLSYRGRTCAAKIPMGGLFNVENILAGVGSALALGHDLEGICSALPHLKPAPGRFELVDLGNGVSAVVDYAHTPDALERLIESVKAIAKGRVAVVFGCGGDRDRAKRPKMAAVVSRLADYCVITSDNPRTEDPRQILEDVEGGIVSGAEAVAILDRADAVAHAVAWAKPGDTVVVAGKGHENYQIVGTVKLPMDDRDLLRDAVGALR